MKWIKGAFFKKKQKTTTARRRIDTGDQEPSYPIYAIGDIHGCIDLLRDAESRIVNDMSLSGRSGLVVLLGDYVAKGPASQTVLDHLIRPSNHGLRRLALCGNHDDVFYKVLQHPDAYPTWLSQAGKQTLLSYGIDLDYLKRQKGFGSAALTEVMREGIPQEHIDFLAGLPVSLKVGPYLFVHAGIKPGVPLDAQHDSDLLWIREPFISQGPDLPLVVVHGHTPRLEVSFGPGRIGIDTGAFQTGNLTVLKIDRGDVSVL
ncbi:metallophosphoesterase [Agrobacterium larrymoorei]|uniref:metallophosphoesterase n=1 Tax=Agrobacterium larrymoorei TaxID=160699 RepID=UPI0030C2B57B